VLIQIDTHGGAPLYRQVMDQVTRMIVSGRLATGDQLESVASLAKRLKINPMTISKAYGYLVEGGLVERRPGIGLFVLPVERQEKRRVRSELLAETIARSAAMAAQLRIGEDEAVRMFVDEFRRTKSREEVAEE
jgi:GntR family transcriptional regulator